MKRVIALVALVLAASSLAACKKGHGAEASAAAAKDMLTPFTKPGADVAALTAALRPKPDDYAVVFTSDAAKAMKASLDPIWDSGKMVLKPTADQTAVEVAGVTTDELKKGEGHNGPCPQAYKDIGDKFNEKITVYCGRFVKPGEKLGLSFDGLVYINDHWAFFPKPFKTLK